MERNLDIVTCLSLFSLDFVSHFFNVFNIFVTNSVTHVYVNADTVHVIKY